MCPGVSRRATQGLCLLRPGQSSTASRPVLRLTAQADSEAKGCEMIQWAKEFLNVDAGAGQPRPGDQGEWEGG